MRLLALILLVVASYGVSAQCSAPSGLSTYGISATAAVATWAPVSGATSYNVEYKPSSSSEWITSSFTTSGLEWHFAYLEASTSYDWRVRATCASGISNYAQTQFTTGPIGSCIAPGGLSTSNITGNYVTMSWSPVPGALSYTVHYKPVSSGTWIVATSSTYLTSVSLVSLSPATTYEWRVYTNCSVIESSGYSTAQFTTTGGSTPPPASPCPGPYDVSTNGYTGGAAAINVNSDVKGTIYPRNDIDYYKFTIGTGGTITVWLTTLPANYNLAVLNSNGTQIGVSQNSGSQSESVYINVTAGTYYAKVFPKGTANKANACYTLRVQPGTGGKVTASATGVTATKENVNPNFTVNLFPNPAGNQLTVSVEGVDKKPVIKVYDLMGKLVMQQGSSNTLTQLDISKLSPGIYMLHVNNGRETKAAKFVKE